MIKGRYGARFAVQEQRGLPRSDRDVAWLAITALFAIWVGAACAPQGGRPMQVIQRTTITLNEVSPPIELILIPPRQGAVGGFYIGKYEITNAQYKAFVDETGYDGSDHPSSKFTEPFLGHWVNGTYPDGQAKHPACYVNWHHAEAFCDWLSKKTGKVVRLPADDEWEFAARGEKGRIYPWGDDWQPAFCNWGDEGKTDGYELSAPVGSFPSGATPEGVHDLAGNIWEWTAEKSLRGGPWCLDPDSMRAEWKAIEDTDRADDKFGFRIVMEP
ncbi:MAG: SUMF1/EgtB/PvdO family nonheme iron enzyme [Armatimonadetes bacterium]|nr:SUMF1/EgtB/PvdO family nonheme iron enzyme [Armatimonadota bacterium]